MILNLSIATIALLNLPFLGPNLYRNYTVIWLSILKNCSIFFEKGLTKTQNRVNSENAIDC